MTQTESFDIIIEQVWEQYSSEIYDLCITFMSQDEDEATGIWAQVYTLFTRKSHIYPELLNNADDTKSWLLRETREAWERRERFLSYMAKANRESWFSKLFRKLTFKL